MLPGDRLVCAGVERHLLGERFSKWWLHVTIVPWFRLADDSEVIVAGLEWALTGIGPFESRVVGEAMFGPKKNRPALLLDTDSPWETIEQKTRSYLHKKRAWLVDETTKRPHQFRPHITLQRQQMSDVAVTEVRELYIIEQKGDFKEVVGIINLGER